MFGLVTIRDVREASDARKKQRAYGVRQILKNWRTKGEGKCSLIGVREQLKAGWGLVKGGRGIITFHFITGHREVHCSFMGQTELKLDQSAWVSRQVPGSLLVLGESLIKQAEHSRQEMHELIKFRIQVNGQPQGGLWLLETRHR